MPPKDFYELDDADAQAFYAAYEESMEPRLTAFVREVSERGGPQVDDLRGSPESLVELWAWFIEHAGEAGGRLPAWYEPDPPDLAECLPPPVLHDVDGVALYLAQALVHAVPQLEWGIGKGPAGMREETENKPVLIGNGYNVDVLDVAYILALRARLHGDGDPGALLRSFRAWVDALTETA